MEPTACNAMRTKIAIAASRRAIRASIAVSALGARSGRRGWCRRSGRSRNSGRCGRRRTVVDFDVAVHGGDLQWITSAIDFARYVATARIGMDVERERRFEVAVDLRE